MKNPPNSSEQALEDYFNDLLGEPAPLKGVESTLAAIENFPPVAPPVIQELPQVRPAARLAHLPTRIAAANLATGAANAPSSAALSRRAFAEPVRTLNLRMPLPPLAPEAPPVAKAPTPLPSAPPQAQPPVAPVVPEPREAPQPRARATPVEPPAAVRPVEETSPVIAESVPQGPAPWLDNGRPAWAQQRFECLLFSVGGLGLAAPLAELGSIYKLEPEALTGIFGQAPWFMGLLPVKGGFNVRVIDAAQVVMPERYSVDMRERYRFVISLHGSDWGLAVDAVADSVILQPDDVRWRSQRGKRPWLAGTVVDRMCALLDVAQLVWMFEGQDGKRTAPRG
jgi:purine-binding chemotaxis protein CheW